MTRPLLSLLLTLCVVSAAAAQNTPKLSPLTRKYLRESRALEQKREPTHPELYVYKVGANRRVYLSALIKVGGSVDERGMTALGVRVGTKAGPIWTVQIPAENVEAFTTIAGIEYIQLDEPLLPNLDSARRATRVDSVHAGYGLPMPYSGANVVIGVIDAGFDYGHPTLFDTSGTLYRVKRVWEQKNGTGTPPSGYLYGTEMTDSATIVAKGTDSNGTHGTHVAGICAGSGFGSATNTRYRGIAYGTDIVFVSITPEKEEWVNTGVSDMIDGINYVYRYAESVGKPAVVNLSWGSPLGPRDGSGLFSQALDNLVGSGKLFVCSAGNNGENKIHLQKTFTPADTTIQTFVAIPETPNGRKTWVDIWGDTGTAFCVQVSLYHDTAAMSSSGVVCLDDSLHEIRLVGTNNDTCIVGIAASAAEFNGKPRIFLDFDSRVADSIVLTVKGNGGTVNIWDSFVYKTSGYYGSFESYGRPWATDGNSDISISDIASSRSAITVGAYASKVGWLNTAGRSYSYSSYVSRGKLVPFSSRGPTADGRVKPDITAPGLTVSSAISSYDTSFAPAGSNAIFLTSTYHDSVRGRDYSYGVLSGTSMSSPVVAGIVALMLQVSPQLTPQEVKQIMSSTSIQDNLTGTIPFGGSNAWGNGKVNAYASMKRVVQLSENVEYLAVRDLGYLLSPNPSTGAFALTYRGHTAERLQVQISNAEGKPLRSDLWQVEAGENVRRYDLEEIDRGVYFVDVWSQSRHTTLKMIVQ